MLGRGSLYNAGSHGGSSSSQSGISIAASSSHSQASAATLTRKRRKADELRQQMERASVVEIPLHDRIRDYDAAMEQMQMQISNGGAGSSSSGSASGAGGHRHRQEDLEREQLCGKWADSNDRRDVSINLNSYDQLHTDTATCTLRFIQLPRILLFVYCSRGPADRHDHT